MHARKVRVQEHLKYRDGEGGRHWGEGAVQGEGRTEGRLREEGEVGGQVGLSPVQSPVYMRDTYVDAMDRCGLAALWDLN